MLNSLLRTVAHSLIGNNKNEHVIFTNLISIYRQGLLFNTNRNSQLLGLIESNGSADTFQKAIAQTA